MFRAASAVVTVLAFLGGCGKQQQEASPPNIRISLPPDDEAGELSWSPDARWAALTVFNKDGHSPMTTTRVIVVRPGIEGYREIRLPPPHERFSTTFERWEAPGVLRVRATTLEDDGLQARYFCGSGRVELLP
ncbi:MAG: hypothetical protein SFV54_17575 [Bryobacteraceae bacterium]|nr:hypothetical protein [Bryobacteraceae bacterium]